jgi:hypothetical protein
MKLLFNYPLVLISLAIFLAPAIDSPAQQNSGALFAASDGKGHISLLWFPPASRWPAGWRLLDSSGQVLAAKIASGETGALQALSVEDADAIRKLPAVLAKPDTNAEQRTRLVNILGMRAFSEPAFARALGLSWSLDSVAPGSRTYKVQGLDSAGKPTGLELTSSAVDSAHATPLPPAPSQVQARGGEAGVGLSWTAAPENRQLPVISYAVERDGAAVTAKPVVVGTHVDSKASLVLDRAAPPNETLTYQVFSVDVFGRRSEPGSIRIFFPDFRALVPPGPVTAAPAAGKVVVGWKSKPPGGVKTNLSGWVVERAYLESGPYEALTAQALAAGSDRYEDASVRGGTSYYYRIRGVGPRGDLGPPSHPAMAQPTNPGKPPKVTGLSAEAGQTRVRLTWQPVTFPVAGYFVERRVVVAAPAPPPNWVRLNPHVTPEPLYDDYTARASDTRLEYRIVAVAFDNAEGLPSDSVPVALPDLSLPDTPSITAASGAEGKVQLGFSPALPEEKTAQFLVLRGGSADDIGVVIGDPLPGSARQFQDLYVSPGESYWYRVVALDKNGNRSDPTAPVVVRVGAPAIPKPSTPALQFTAAPYPHVALQFAKAPAGLAVVVERQAGAGGFSGWTRIAGPLGGDQLSVTDNAPPDSRPLAYRVAYVSAGGQVGPASDPAMLNGK